MTYGTSAPQDSQDVNGMTLEVCYIISPMLNDPHVEYKYIFFVAEPLPPGHLKVEL
jgi:hypothetical protein